MSKNAHALDHLLGKRMVSSWAPPERRKTEAELQAMSDLDRLIYQIHHPLSEDEKQEALEQEDMRHRLGMGDDRADAQLAARAQDPQGDLPAVGHQDLAEHRRSAQAGRRAEPLLDVVGREARGLLEGLVHALPLTEPPQEAGDARDAGAVHHVLHRDVHQDVSGGERDRVSRPAEALDPLEILFQV